ncbi:MAG: hypothetical protein HQL16_08220, partial [Candidatus Omnitrophica bacterium]|nr:hypothetical protein [Candidatus Omnitrophota bacterium]
GRLIRAMVSVEKRFNKIVYASIAEMIAEVADEAAQRKLVATLNFLLSGINQDDISPKMLDHVLQAYFRSSRQGRRRMAPALTRISALVAPFLLEPESRVAGLWLQILNMGLPVEYHRGISEELVLSFNSACEAHGLGIDEKLRDILGNLERIAQDNGYLNVNFLDLFFFAFTRPQGAAREMAGRTLSSLRQGGLFRVGKALQGRVLLNDKKKQWMFAVRALGEGGFFNELVDALSKAKTTKQKVVIIRQIAEFKSRKAYEAILPFTFSDNSGLVTISALAGLVTVGDLEGLNVAWTLKRRTKVQSKRDLRIISAAVWVYEQLRQKLIQGLLGSSAVQRDHARVLGAATPEIFAELGQVLKPYEGKKFNPERKRFPAEKEAVLEWLGANEPVLAGTLRAAVVSRAPPELIADILALEQKYNVRVSGVNLSPNVILVIHEDDLSRTLIHEGAALAGWNHADAEALAQKFVDIAWLLTRPHAVNWLALLASGRLAGLKGTLLGVMNYAGRLKIVLDQNFSFMWPDFSNPKWWGRGAVVSNIGVRGNQVWVDIVFKKKTLSETRRFVLVWGEKAYQPGQSNGQARMVWGLKEENVNLAWLVSQPKDTDWEKLEQDGALNLFKGLRVAATENKLARRPLVIHDFKYDWSILGHREFLKGFVIEDIGVRGGQVWINVVPLSNEKARRKLVMVWGKRLTGVGAQKRNTRLAWGLKEEIWNLGMLLARPADITVKDLRKSRILERLKGASFGLTDKKGRKTIPLGKKAVYSWKALGRDESGWEVEVVDAREKGSQAKKIVIEVLLRKDGRREKRTFIFTRRNEFHGWADRRRKISAWKLTEARPAIFKAPKARDTRDIARTNRAIAGRVADELEAIVDKVNPFKLQEDRRFEQEKRFAMIWLLHDQNPPLVQLARWLELANILRPDAALQAEIRKFELRHGIKVFSVNIQPNIIIILREDDIVRTFIHEAGALAWVNSANVHQRAEALAQKYVFPANIFKRALANYLLTEDDKERENIFLHLMSVVASVEDIFGLLPGSTFDETVKSPEFVSRRVRFWDAVVRSQVEHKGNVHEIYEEVSRQFEEASSIMARRRLLETLAFLVSKVVQSPTSFGLETAISLYNLSLERTERDALVLALGLVVTALAEKDPRFISNAQHDSLRESLEHALRTGDDFASRHLWPALQKVDKNLDMSELVIDAAANDVIASMIDIKAEMFWKKIFSSPLDAAALEWFREMNTQLPAEYEEPMAAIIFAAFFRFIHSDEDSQEKKILQFCNLAGTLADSGDLNVNFLETFLFLMTVNIPGLRKTVGSILGSLKNQKLFDAAGLIRQKINPQERKSDKNKISLLALANGGFFDELVEALKAVDDNILTARVIVEVAEAKLPGAVEFISLFAYSDSDFLAILALEKLRDFKDPRAIPIASSLAFSENSHVKEAALAYLESVSADALFDEPGQTASRRGWNLALLASEAAVLVVIVKGMGSFLVFAMAYFFLNWLVVRNMDRSLPKNTRVLARTRNGKTRYLQAFQKLNMLSQIMIDGEEAFHRLTTGILPRVNPLNWRKTPMNALLTWPLSFVDEVLAKLFVPLLSMVYLWQEGIRHDNAEARRLLLEKTEAEKEAGKEIEAFKQKIIGQYRSGFSSISRRVKRAEIYRWVAALIVSVTAIDVGIFWIVPYAVSGIATLWVRLFELPAFLTYRSHLLTQATFFAIPAVFFSLIFHAAARRAAAWFLASATYEKISLRWRNKDKGPSLEIVFQHITPLVWFKWAAIWIVTLLADLSAGLLLFSSLARSAENNLTLTAFAAMAGASSFLIGLLSLLPTFLTPDSRSFWGMIFSSRVKRSLEDEIFWNTIESHDKFSDADKAFLT